MPSSSLHSAVRSTAWLGVVQCSAVRLGVVQCTTGNLRHRQDAQQELLKSSSSLKVFVRISF